MERKLREVLPLYLKVASQLRQGIKSGKIAVGSSLGTQAALMRKYGVSRVTLRHAIRILEREGLVVTHQGKGSYVTSTGVMQELGDLLSLGEIVEAQGLPHEVRVYDYTWVMPPQSIASFFGSPSESPVLRIKRLHTVNNLPMALAIIHLPAEIGVRLSRPDFEKYPIYTMMEKRLGFKLGKAVQQIRAIAAEGEIATSLGVDPGYPLLVAERKTYMDDGRPVEGIVFFYRSDCYRFTINLQRAEMLPMVVPPFPGQKKSDTVKKGGGDSNVAASLHLSGEQVE